MLLTNTVIIDTATPIHPPQLNTLSSSSILTEIRYEKRNKSKHFVAPSSNDYFRAAIDRFHQPKDGFFLRFFSFHFIFSYQDERVCVCESEQSAQNLSWLLWPMKYLLQICMQGWHNMPPTCVVGGRKCQHVFTYCMHACVCVCVWMILFFTLSHAAETHNMGETNTMAYTHMKEGRFDVIES